MNVKRWKYAGKKVDPFYLSRAWKEMRWFVLRRDQFWCRVCNRRFANTVHHIKPRKERPDLALNPSNLESICAVCHNQEHPEKGRGKKEEQRDLGFVRIVKV